MSTTPQNFGLRLRGLTLEDLRGLAQKHLPEEERVEHLDRNALIRRLAEAAENNRRLARAIRDFGINLKLSFFLMSLAEADRVTKDSNWIKRKLAQEEKRLEGETKGDPKYKGFRHLSVNFPSEQLLEIEFQWQHLHWYWAPEDWRRAHVYELRYGFALLDFKGKKAILSCNDEAERQVLAKLLAEALDIRLKPLRLTRQLLDEIGSFDYVRRAKWERPKSEKYPLHVSYADENLSSKEVAREQEDDTENIRKESFYTIPLDEFGADGFQASGDQLRYVGVGVTSDSGKLWIPRQVPKDSIREYAYGLFRRISEQINQLVLERRLGEIADLNRVDEVASLKAMPAALRPEVMQLAIRLASMLIEKTEVADFTLGEHLAVGGVPKYFLHPRLKLIDPEAPYTAYWHTENRGSEWVNVVRTKGSPALRDPLSGEAIDLTSLTHPATGNPVAVDDVMDALEFYPAPDLVRVLKDCIRQFAGEYPALLGLNTVPFFIDGRAIHLRWERALGLSDSLPEVENAWQEVAEFATAQAVAPQIASASGLTDRMFKLGEKCTSMSDEECSGCLRAQKYLCLRSLVASFLDPKTVKLLAHKGIELADMQAKVTVGSQKLTAWAFAKTGNKGKTGLTARNDDGAVLLAQVLSQINKSDFQVVMILTAGAVNDDLTSRLRLLCEVFGKRLLILDGEAFKHLLLTWEVGLASKGLDATAIYKGSQKKLALRSASKKVPVPAAST